MAQKRQDYNTNEMIYSLAEYISYLSKDYTLVPGDVITGATGSGTAAGRDEAPPRHNTSQSRPLSQSR
jgi:2-keto-4-pentenoate hydratase/2-oxohepta-3-ene-1,7-dioic acid hydratase in catechol pathway